MPLDGAGGIDEIAVSPHVQTLVFDERDPHPGVHTLEIAFHFQFFPSWHFARGIAKGIKNEQDKLPRPSARLARAHSEAVNLIFKSVTFRR